MSKQVVRHYRLRDIEGMVFYGMLPFSEQDKEYLGNKLSQMKRNKQDNYGGFTMVIDTERKVIGVALCSLKDQYCKKTGVQQAAARTDVTMPLWHHVVAPKTRSKLARMLCKTAMYAAFTEHMKRDWPLNLFQVNIVDGPYY